MIHYTYIRSHKQKQETMKTYKSMIPRVRVVMEPTDVERVKISSSRDATDYLRRLWPDDLEYCECFVALYMNRNNNVVAFSVISKGGVSSTVADPKIIFQHGLLAHAHGLIVAHNHPSGNLKPSGADISLSRKLKQVGEIMEMPVFDSLIITIDGYYSLADGGLI